MRGSDDEIQGKGASFSLRFQIFIGMQLGINQDKDFYGQALKIRFRFISMRRQDILHHKILSIKNCSIAES